MGTTPKGLPYPEGTDLVVDGDDAMQALAEAVDAKIAYGVANGTLAIPMSDDVTNGGTVTFPAGKFTMAPTVTATAATSYYNISASNVSASSVLLTCRHINATPGSSTVYVLWEALQMAAPAALFAASLASSPDVTVTCPTAGCGNEGIPIPIVSTYVDDDGVTQTVDNVSCGVCGADITSTLTPIDPGV